MSTDIQFKRGTASALATVNPFLLAGEPCFETDSNRFKIGDGVNNWNALAYQNNAQSTTRLDNIAPQFNGVTTTFNLRTDDVAVTPLNAANILVTLNNVIQEPFVDYGTTNATIVFVDPPAATDTFFGLAFGTFGQTYAAGTGGGTGAPGPQGPRGATGPQGVTGATGPQGLAGAQGEIGPTGPTGPQGVQGLIGVTGPQGEIGLTGATGPQGEIGLTGATGPQGEIGSQGATGPEGPAGAIGATGPAGFDGLPGAIGPQGEIGPQGATGPQGNDGATGVTGPQGLQGLRGATGVIGPTGPQGEIGPQGATGPQGNDGATGPQGLQGPASTKTLSIFDATRNQPPATNFATLDTRNSVAVLDFDDTTQESAIFVGVIPEAVSTENGLKVRIHWMATTATSGDVHWEVALARSNTDIAVDSFDAAQAETTTTSITSGIISVTEITLTAVDGVTAGDLYRLRVARAAANDADTMTGDAELVAVEIRMVA